MKLKIESLSNYSGPGDEWVDDTTQKAEAPKAPAEPPKKRKIEWTTPGAFKSEHR